MPERRDIQEALREAVDRTVRTTVGTGQRAQGAAGGVVDDLLRGAERGSRGVRDLLPASQDDIRALRAELDRIDRRLEAIERRLPQIQK